MGSSGSGVGFCFVTQRASSAIRTERLDLVPMTPAFLRASIRGDLVEAARQIHLSVPGDWPDNHDVLKLRLQQLESDPTLQPWLLRGIGLRANREMIGHIGFHHSPGADYLKQWSPGGAELGFTVFARHRRKGYAREAALALMRWAQEVHCVTSFVVTISPTNVASRALAAELGFGWIGSHVDQIDGVEDVLVRSSPK